MNDQLSDVVQRTYRYYYDDGLVELGIGGLFLTVGIWLLVWARAALGSWLGLVVALGLPATILLGVFALNKAIQVVKERVTYLRTGYVAYRPEEPGQGRWLIVSAGLGLAILSTVFPQWLSKMALAEGLLLCAVLAYTGYRVGLRRFFLLAAIAALLGLVVTFLVPGDLLGSSLVFGGSGIALLLSGALALRAYLHAHPDVVEDAL